jgi:hypothetical protein
MDQSQNPWRTLTDKELTYRGTCVSCGQDIDVLLFLSKIL